jgi:7-cyano-7-deazaguanine synthase in queuosine biosynthesis
MNIICGTNEVIAREHVTGELAVSLYEQPTGIATCSAGTAVLHRIKQAGLVPAQRAWDLLSIALSVVAADVIVTRNTSPDGWTRELGVRSSVSEPDFWNAQEALLEHQLRFLTTDVWGLRFIHGGTLSTPPAEKRRYQGAADSVTLLSGGLDSLIGLLDLVHEGKQPFAVSQIQTGDAERQVRFANASGVSHLALNHNVHSDTVQERSQRARSFIFLAYGVLVATSLPRYVAGDTITLYVCENGYISLNPSLAPTRLGSLSTRTTHPRFLQLYQRLLDKVELRVRVVNPYQLKTKGEMLEGCADQAFLVQHAHEATSCGRFGRNGYRHCGRCVPCLVRRAAFHKWGTPDRTNYVYNDLARHDEDHAGSDDVRVVGMAIAQVNDEGLDSVIGASMNRAVLGDVTGYRAVVERGLRELEAYFNNVGVS